ncbi:MAG: hypothetical protein EA369_06330 [Bradymonadales bacterium]|nr:MAG: hypothetical protein EA369_06330 [Bradymonadales bacterium]
MRDAQVKTKGRPFLGIFFECCQVYQRIYREPDATRYQGHCPRCYRSIRLRVDPTEGSNCRFWRAL